MARAQSGTDQTLAEHGTSTEQVGKSLDSAVQDAEKELKKDQTVQQVCIYINKLPLYCRQLQTGCQGNRTGNPAAGH